MVPFYDVLLGLSEIVSPHMTVSSNGVIQSLPQLFPKISSKYYNHLNHHIKYHDINYIGF